MFNWYDFSSTVEEYLLHKYDGSDYEEPLLMEKYCIVNKLTNMGDNYLCTNCPYNTGIKHYSCARPCIAEFLH